VWTRGRPSVLHQPPTSCHPGTPEQLNVLANYRSTAALQDLRVAGQRTDFYPLPACRGYLRDVIGYICSSREKCALRTEFSASFERTYRNTTIGQIRSMTPSAGLHTDHTTLLTDSVPTFVVKLSYSWLPVGVRETMQRYDCSLPAVHRNRDRTPSVLLPCSGTLALPVSHSPCRHPHCRHLTLHHRISQTASGAGLTPAQ
jgi:hypothetical protein